MYKRRKMAQGQDKRISKETGLKIQVNSGAVSGRKGDLYGPDILVETKTSEQPKKSVSAKRAWIATIEEQAFSMGKTFWALVVGDETTGEDFVIMPLNLFNVLCESRTQLEEMLSENKS